MLRLTWFGIGCLELMEDSFQMLTCRESKDMRYIEDFESKHYSCSCVHLIMDLIGCRGRSSHSFDVRAFVMEVLYAYNALKRLKRHAEVL